MKRLGVQIAAGAVTVLLGVLAAAHAQKDREDTPETAWKSGDVAELRQASKPIGEIGESRAGEPDDGGQPTAAEPGADPAAGVAAPTDADASPIRLVQHTDAFDSQGAFESPHALRPPADETGPPADEAPIRDDSGDADTFGDAPSFGMPPSLAFESPDSEAPDSDPSQPESSQRQSPQPEFPVAASAPESTGTSEPESAFGQSPSMAFPGFGGRESDATIAPRETSEPGTSAESNGSNGPNGSNGSNGSNGPNGPNGPNATVVAGGADDRGFDIPPINGLREPDGPNGNAYDLAAPTADGTSRRGDIRPGYETTSPAESPRAIENETGADETPASRFGSWAGQPPLADQPPQESSIDRSETAPPRLASLPQGSPQETPDKTPEDTPLQDTPLQDTALQDTALQDTAPEDASPEFVAGSREMRPIDQRAHATSAGPARNGQRFGGGRTAESFSEQDPNGRGSSEREGFQIDPQHGQPRTLGSPGDRRLEGAQTPSLVIQKRAPSEVKVGKPASFVIAIRNVGSAEAIDVRLHDRVPVGMRLADASPSPVRQGEELVWHLGALPAGDERTVTMQLVPEQEGELGSVARVSFEAAASVRTVSTRPELKIVQRAPEAVLIGQQLEIELEVSNPGTGEAVGVVLQEDVPEGLEHPKGRQLDNLLGNLQPGEVRREVLRLRAVAPGQIQNTVRLVSEDGLTAEHTVDVAVIAPQLQVGLNGPTRRYVGRQATYEVQVTNAGTAEASNLEIAAFLDRGFTFVSTENQGQYDPNRHAVFWSLARLPEAAAATVPLTLLPVEVGEQAIRVEANADLGAEGRHEQTVAVDSLAELTFRLSDASDPIEMGAETTYEIRVTNSGSRDDANVRVELELPAGLKLLSSDVDAEQDDRGRVYFEPHGRLDAGGELTYRVKVRGVAPGRHVTKATVVSDQSGVAVTKEESTMIYSDR